MAGNFDTWGDFLQFWCFLFANIGCVSAAWVEMAASWWLGGVWYISFQSDELAFALLLWIW